MNRKILVTGATGSNGKEIVKNSIKLLRKLGFHDEQLLRLPNQEKQVKLFAATLE